MGRSMYIHIPFCEHICHYCDFNKVFLENQPVNAYIEALIQEMKEARRVQGDVPVRTIYIGGGTPTALTALQLRTLLEAMHAIFHLEEVEEWTVEVNPDSADGDKLAVLKAFGVTRLSIGVQTFTPELLSEIGRTHSPTSVTQAIETARAYGFDNISVDLMLGLPKQRVEDFSEAVDQALALGVQHISAYALKIEQKTVFFNRHRKGQLSLPPEETDVAMYDLLKVKTKEAGLSQYEISNFGKPGYESRHNLVYWNNEEYDGFGAGASGYDQGIRYQNINPVQKYIDAVTSGKMPRLREHKVPLIEKVEESVFLGLRKREGVEKVAFARQYGVELETLFGEEIEEGKRRGLLEESEARLRLTEDGLLLGNEAFELFLAVLDDEDLAKVKV
ncbi:radical SAM family heme chaperone HemW [Shouchella shacheensis]|uniref:radical SAM family heme chaperone HemW n=1 Tax=Shouchella shacheensis TaxID=1649580 RepID=UPI000A51BFF5|nr:radical SAM family heme chaperone HemW [Shouchella shacheensis]